MHNYLLFFTKKGRCYWLKVYDLPEGAKNTKGRAIQNLLNIDSDDAVNAVIRIKKLTYGNQLALYQLTALMLVIEYKIKPRNKLLYFRILIMKLVLFESGKVSESHLHDGKSLRIGKLKPYRQLRTCKLTQMQSSFSVNNVAIVNGRPKTLNLKQILEAFISSALLTL